MQVGAVFPQLELGSDPADLARYAQTVEALGYDHLVVFDHVLGATRDRPGGERFAYDERSTFHEPFVLLAYLAARTTRVGLATAVIVLPQRQTALVAKQAAEVDLLCGGRFRLGVGVGWNFVEFEALGQTFTDRGRRIEEQIELLRRLWTEPVVDHRGRWHRVDRAGLAPLPVQRPIPVWMGGDADVAVRRIARLADGWFTHLRPNDAGREALARFRGYAREAGRDADAIPVEGRIASSRGLVDEWVRGAALFRDMGLTHIELTTMGAGYRSLDEHLDALARFREQLTRSGVA